jgi:K+-transporting ATPase A subunit
MNLCSSLFTATTNPIAIVAVIAAIAILVQSSFNVGYAQEMAVKEKEDVFKVIVTLFGVEPATGNIVTFVTIDNMSKVKAFDAAKYYIPIDTTASYNSTTNHGVEGSGIVELNLAFPNATSIKSGDEFRVCSMVLKDLRMICETGVNTPALRAENVDMYLDTAQFLKVEDMEVQTATKDNVDVTEEVLDVEEEDTASDEADEEEEE